MSLHPLVGHEKLRETLGAAHARGTLPSSLLFHGARGVGKQRLALWLAQLLVCLEPSGQGPCERCGPCRMTLSLEHPDVHWYFPLERPKKVSGDRLVDALEDARMQALDAVRQGALTSDGDPTVRGLYLGAVRNVRARAHKRPTMAEGQVFIIGDAEYLVPQEASQEAANALLKLLEEPPGASRFILTSSDPGLLLPTILSRTVPLHVPRLPDEEVERFLLERADTDAKNAAWAASLGRGSIGRSLAFLPSGDEPGTLEATRRRAFEIVRAATSADPSARHVVAIRFRPVGARTLLPLFGFVEECLRDLAAVASGAGGRLLNPDAEKFFTDLTDGDGLSPVDITDAFRHVEWARELARANVNPQLVVSGLVRDLAGTLRPAAALAR